MRPDGLLRLCHVALNVRDLDGCRHFYVDLLGMRIEWQPDPDNLYLTGGGDNLALHRATSPVTDEGQHLDHIGFSLATAEAVDHWHVYLRDSGVTIEKPPRTHRDGARSFYCRDPDGNVVQFIHYLSLLNP